jgi:23S rRNA-/tRNA-specific pseudouridylate synthase
VSEPRTVFGVGERDRGKRLDRFLHEHIPGISRARIQRAIEERVTLSWGVTPRASTPVRPGGVVEVGYTPITEELLDVPIPVIARGDGWLAVDKPAGIPVHPVNSVRENTIIRMLRRQEGIEGLRLTHRLDRETTGVLLVAENAGTASTLSTASSGGG